jgi:hypothetical protein
MMLNGAERRLLRFLQSSKTTWTHAKVIRNTEELLPGDEKVLAGLMRSGLVLEHASGDGYRISRTGASALAAMEGNALEGNAQ